MISRKTKSSEWQTTVLGLPKAGREVCVCVGEECVNEK